MYGTLIDRCHRAIEAEKTIGYSGYSIKDKNTGMVYKYGDNPYVDMCIENCVFVDSNTDIVENPDDYFGFNRSNWELIIN